MDQIPVDTLNLSELDAEFKRVSENIDKANETLQDKTAEVARLTERRNAVHGRLTRGKAVIVCTVEDYEYVVQRFPGMRFRVDEHVDQATKTAIQETAASKGRRVYV
ncbi:hypothetical protein vseg_020311 [Gypsophila vaccaria]